MITIQLTVPAAQGAPRVPLEIDETITARDLRQEASKATKIPQSSIKLIFRGRLITESDQAAVTEYKLEEGSVLHCMGKPAANGEASSNAAAASTAASATSTNLPTVSVPSSGTASLTSAGTETTTSSDPLRAALQTLRTSNPPDTYQTAITTLDKILNNITQHPLEEKYRALKVHNPAFQRRLGGLPGGDAAIKACGFTVQTSDDGVEKYVMEASAEAWPALQQTARTVQAAAALASSNSTTNNNAGAPLGAAGLGAGGMPNFMPPMGMGGGGGFGGAPPADSPAMQQAAAALMSNPQQLQAMLRDPMVQNMIRSDPRFASNPMAQQAMERMANDPQMAAMMAQMMSDPQALEQLRALSPGGGGMNGAPPNPEQMAQMMNMFGSVAPAAAGMNRPGGNNTQQQPPNNNNSGGGGGGANDEDLTEEEMIAEAIRRSLQDDSNGGGS